MEMDMMTMCMYFYNSTKVKMIFKGWDPESNGEYFGCLVFAFLIAFLAEYLSVERDKVDSNAVVRLKAEGPQLLYRMFQSVIIAFQVFFSFLTMLAVMTYNTGVVAACVLGLGTAYFIFGFSPSQVRLTHNYFLNARDTDTDKGVNNSAAGMQ